MDEDEVEHIQGLMLRIGLHETNLTKALLRGDYSIAEKIIDEVIFYKKWGIGVTVEAGILSNRLKVEGKNVSSTYIFRLEIRTSWMMELFKQLLWT